MNTRSTLLVAGITLLFIIVAVVVVLSSFFSTPQKSSISSDNFSTQLPISNAPHSAEASSSQSPVQSEERSSGTISVRSLNGLISVRDFTKDSDTAMTPEEDAWYIVYPKKFEFSDKDLWYEIAYTPADSRISVVIYREPIGEVRAKATSDLLGRLGITAQELCTLDSLVFAPRWVNNFYADKNLGFPGCPGATKFSEDSVF